MHVFTYNAVIAGTSSGTIHSIFYRESHDQKRVTLSLILAVPFQVNTFCVMPAQESGM